MKRFVAVLALVVIAVLMVVVPVGAQGDGLDYTIDPIAGEFALETGFFPDPFIINVPPIVGNVSVRDLSLGVGCTGVSTEGPMARLFWEGDPSNLRIYFVAHDENGEIVDTTLIINQPDASWACNDDGADSSGDYVFSPTVDITDSLEGQYDIWVGSFSEDVAFAGYIFITEITDNFPGSTFSPLFGTIINPNDE